MKLLNAQEIKALLIDQLIDGRFDGVVLGAEVPFIAGKRWADVLVVDNAHTRAFEIKSALDSLDKLKDQTTDYLDTFDFTTLVVSEMHLKEARRLVTDYVGIIVLKENGVLESIYAPKQRLRQKKEHLLNFLWRDDLIKAIRKKQPISGNVPEAFYLRKKVMELYSTPEIRNMAMTRQI